MLCSLSTRAGGSREQERKGEQAKDWDKYYPGPVQQLQEAAGHSGRILGK